MRLQLGFVAVCLALCAFGNSSRAEQVLNFDFGSEYGDGTFIPADYGSTPPLATVSHRLLDEDGNAIEPLRHWHVGYGTLVGVAWGGDPEGTPSNWNQFAEFEFTAIDGYLITLSSFDLAAFNNYFPTVVDVNILVKDYGDDEWEAVSSELVDVPNGTDPGFITLERSVTAKAVRLQWGFPEAVAIDNIRFTISEVPEPASIVAWLIGAACLGCWGYRRRRA